MASSADTARQRLGIGRDHTSKTPCPDGGECRKSGVTCGDPICVQWHNDLQNPIITGPPEPIIGRSNPERAQRWRYNTIIKQQGGRPLLELWR